MLNLEVYNSYQRFIKLAIFYIRKIFIEEAFKTTYKFAINNL